MTGFSFATLTTAAQFEGVRQDWESLYQRSPSATPFLAHDWLTTYWRVFGDESSLRVVCVRDAAGILVAAAALRTRRRHGVRTLAPVAADVTDFSDILLDGAVPNVEEQLAAALLALPDWDVIELPESPPDGQAWRLLAVWPGHSVIRPASVCLELPIGPPETLMGSLPAKQRRHLRRNERLDLRDMPVPAEPAPLGQAVGDLLDLHTREWAGRGGNRLHATDAFRRHLTAAVQCLAPLGRATITRHCLTGSLVAVSLTLLSRDMIGGYLYGADPAVRKEVDISALLIKSGLIIGRAHGLTRLSLLRGEESGKLRWAPQARRNQRMLLLRPTVGRGGAVAVSALLAHASRSALGGSRTAARVTGWLRP